MSKPTIGSRLGVASLVHMLQLGRRNGRACRRLDKRLVPADAFPFAHAALADTLHRSLHAVGIVGLSRSGDALLAYIAFLRLAAGVVQPLRAENLPVFDDGFERTVLMVAPTRARSAHKRLFAHYTLPLSPFFHDNAS